MAVELVTATDVVITVDRAGVDVTVGCWSQAALNITAEELQTACAATAGYRGRSYGQIDVTMTLDMIYRTRGTADTEQTMDDFIAAQLAKEFLDVTFAVGTTDGKTYSGSFMITSNNVTINQQSGEATGSVTLGINGALTAA